MYRSFSVLSYIMHFFEIWFCLPILAFWLWTHLSFAQLPAVGHVANMAVARRDQIILLNSHGGNFHGHDHHDSIHIHSQNNNRGVFGTVDIHPDTVLAGVSGLGAAFLVATYIALTQQGNGKRKRRRQLDDYSPLPVFGYVEPLLVAGKELL